MNSANAVTEVNVSSRNEALTMASFLMGHGYATCVFRVGPKSYAWDADALPIGYTVSFSEVAS